MTDKSAEYRAIVDRYQTRQIKALKRPPFILDNLVYLPLPSGRLAFTEAEYYELVNGCLWSENSHGYVMGHQKYAPRRKLHKWLWYHIHGEIPKDRCMDHINRNRLDNRLENLRVVTYSQNSRNTKKKGTSKYRGVHFDANAQKWRATILSKGKHYHMGLHCTEDEAYAAYYVKAVELGLEDGISMKPKAME